MSPGEGAVGFRMGTWGIGLRPPTPSSVEPIGTPRRPTAVEAIPVGDDADAAGLPAAAPMAAQVPEAVPTMPPPSKSEPGAALGMPVLDPPLKLPAGELIAVHVVLLLLVDGVSGEVTELVGLTPADWSSVAPSGTPAGGTGEAGPMPSGEVIPSGDGALVLVWAHAGPHSNNAAITPINMRVMITASSKSLLALSRDDTQSE